MGPTDPAVEMKNTTPSSIHLEMTEAEWKLATRFDSTDFGWIIMSIGMAIGAGIVFLPVQVGLVGIWVFLLASVLGYPAMYLFQRLFINTLLESHKCSNYSNVISGYLGRNWGVFLGMLYFVMTVIWVFVYSTTITNDSASYLQTFGITKDLLSNHPLYSLFIICILVSIASRGEKLLFRISTLMVITKLLVVAFLGVIMIGMWDVSNISAMPSIPAFIKNSIVTLPFTLTSILFLPSLSPMIISYRAREKSVQVARFKAMRSMNIAFGVLFTTVFFYAVSFSLAISHEQAQEAFHDNVSALAIAARYFRAEWAVYLGVVLNIFAVMTAFFAVYMGFREACQGLALNLLRRRYQEEQIDHKKLNCGIIIFTILIAWGAVLFNAPVLYFTSICSPIFGIVGCLIPAYLVYRIEALHKYKGIILKIIILTGMLLCISPFLVLF